MWELQMLYFNYKGMEVAYWWPIFKSYEECRFMGDMLTNTLQAFNDAHVIYSLCFGV